MAVTIHPTAFVEKGAELDEGVVVGPFCLVGPQVKIGKNTHLESHIVVKGRVTIGSRNVFEPFAVIGGAPQDLTYKGEDTAVEIGDQNTFRESVTVHRGTAKGGGMTRIGNQNYIMAYAHVGHDCILKNNIIMVNQVQLAGHVEIQDYAVIGGQSAITQHCRMGAYSFLGAHSILRKDLPPYMAAKDFSEVSGPNLVGLRRHKLDEATMRLIRDLYRRFYLSTSTVSEVMQEIQTDFPENPWAQRFIDFVKATKQGVQR